MSPTQIIHEFAVKNLLAEKYLLGELSGADLEDFTRHMFECSICFEEVKIGTWFKQSLNEGVSAPVPKSKSWRQRIKEWWNK